MLYQTAGELNIKSFPYNSSSNQYGKPIQGQIPFHNGNPLADCRGPNSYSTQNSEENCKNHCTKVPCNGKMSVVSYDSNNGDCHCLNWTNLAGYTGFIQKM
jgi:hypothetical protein